MDRTDPIDWPIGESRQIEIIKYNCGVNREAC